MPTYVYGCAAGHVFEWPQGFTESALVHCWEPDCFAAAARVLQPPRVVVKGGRPSMRVNGDHKLRREYVAHNADGSETVYGSVQQATRGEYDRLGHTAFGRRIAKKNVAHLRKAGYVPGTHAATFAQALDDRPNR